MHAVRVLVQLEQEDREPTPDEARTLAQYVGWGGLSHLFDEQLYEDWQAQERGEELSWYRKREVDEWAKKWGRFAKPLREMLSREEWLEKGGKRGDSHLFPCRLLTRVASGR